MRDTAIGQLESSHRRHDDRLELLVAAAEQLAGGHGGPADLEELEDQVTWFARSVPMHFGDEDEVVFPALVAARADLAAPLAAFTAEHPALLAAHAHIRETVLGWAGREPAGDSLPGFLAAVRDLATRYRDHAAREDVLVASAADAIVQQGWSWWDAFFGLIPGSAGETSAFCCLIGAVILIVSGIGSWRTMAACVIGVVGTALLINVSPLGVSDGIGGLPAHWHLVTGGFAFGAVFMATDPVTCPETDRGKWIYGILIGVLTVLVRCVNPAYPEGVMLAILLMNAFAPTIDHFIVQANARRRRARLLG
jgi:Na(+)-translocating NADH:ubiquinone oxidoreductase B subunit